MPTGSSPAHRILRLLLLSTALTGGAFGQYWLSVRYAPTWSAAAWTAGVVSFVLWYWAAREGRDLPAVSTDKPGRNEWLWFGAVFALGTFFKLFKLSEFPPGLNHDAAWEGLYAISILKGAPYTPYISAAWGRETLTFYFRAVTVWLLGTTPLAVYLPSVIAGILILPFLYWWARNSFGRRTALIVTLLLGVSGWSLVFSRTGWRSDFQPLFTTITCCFFIRAMLRVSRLDFILAGISLAATLNIYNAARAFPLVFALWVPLFALQSWHWRGFIKRYASGLFDMAVAFIVAVGPLAWYALHNWQKFQGRAAYLSGEFSALTNLKKTALMLNFFANGDDFFVNTPGLEYFSAVFFVFGLLWCLLRWRDERSQFVLIGLTIGVLPGYLSDPNMNRTIGSMPFVFFLAGLGVVCFAGEISRLIPRIGSFLSIVFMAGIGLAAAYATYIQYLGPQHRMVWGYYPETTVIGKYMATIMPSHRVWVGGANFPRDAMTFLSYKDGDPFEEPYTWLNDVSVLLRGNRIAPGDKGLAFIIAAEGIGNVVIAELERRYPEHQTVDLRYPPGRVFARAVVVPAHTEVLPEGAVPAVALPPAVAAPGALDEPRGVAVLGDGTVVVCDFGNHRIQELSRTSTFVRQWGGEGEAPGAFKQPAGVAVSPQDEIYVADTWNHRIQVFAKDGKYLRQWVGGFFSPRGVAVDSKGSVYVADSGNNRVVRFSARGDKEAEWDGSTNAGRFTEPIGITVDKGGRVYVCDNGGSRLQIFNRDGRAEGYFSVSGWGSRAYSEPHVVVAPEGTIWVTVPSQHEVRAYDGKGKLLRTIGSHSVKGQEFEIPLGIAFDPGTKELVVADVHNKIVRLPMR
ncbi:MAG: SMP-30/gluconolactonase/LRE family protein [Deltaproteobacteria bacterium]|nr:SMP-30/gluconolactonase/LRE family protein [Deltaproteobacteria bacterium]